MATTQINLTGSGGLSVRHYESTPNLTYNASEGQLAGGIYNPFKKYGYLSPANNSIIPCTGTINNRIICSDYDSVNDDLYFGGGNILLRLDGLADLSVTTALTIDTDRDILDTEIYEINAQRVLAYVTDTSDTGDGMSIGFMGLDSESGMTILDMALVEAGYQNTYEEVSATSTIVKMAQKFSADDIYITRKIDKIRVRLSRLGAGTTYSVRVGIQANDPDTNLPTGTFLAYGDVAASTISQLTGTSLGGEDIFVTLSSELTLDLAYYWLVVEPEDIADITGTNSFGWYRSNNNNPVYNLAYPTSDANAYVNTGTWATAYMLKETFDFSIMLTKTENWFPVKDDGLYEFETKTTFMLAETIGGSKTIGSLKIDDTHIAVAWSDSASDGKIQVFSINKETSTITAVGTAYEFDITAAYAISLTLLSATHLVITWLDSDNDGRTIVAAISAGYQLSAAGAVFEFEPVSFDWANNIQTYTAFIDSTHFAIVWGNNTDNKIYVQTFAVDGSFTITAVGTKLEVASGAGNCAILRIDATHYLISWKASDGSAMTRVFGIDGSYAWSALGTAALDFGDSFIYFDQILIDSTHVLVLYANANPGKAVTLAIDGSYNVTLVDKIQFTDLAQWVSVSLYEDDKYVVTYYGSNGDGYATVLQIDGSYLITKQAYSYEFDTVEYYFGRTFSISDNLIVAVGSSADGTNNKGKIYMLYPMKVFGDNNFYIKEGQNSFIRRADNGLLYWFTGNDVHSIDGSLTGGNTGTFNRSILRFPSYTEIVDAVDARGFMFIGIHGTNTATGTILFNKFSTSPCGVYIWDRLSTVVRARDFISIEGAREIKKLFLSRNGDVMLITISNNGFPELRKLSNSKFIVVAKLHILGFPEYTDSITFLDNMVAWISRDGKIYAYGAVESGDPEALHMIGDIGVNATDDGYSTGVLTLGSNGTESKLISLYTSWVDRVGGLTDYYKLSKWYPIGEGVLSSVTQKANAGNVYSSVKLLPQMSTVNHINLYNLPIATNDSTDMGDIKIYFNQSTTPWATKQITKKDLYKGVVFIPVGKSYINSVQIEIEWDTAVVLSADMWNPLFAEVDYTPTRTINKK